MSEIKGDGETWEAYAHRLERRIKQQRDHLEAMNRLRKQPGNIHSRKKIDRLTSALGRMTLRWEYERDCRAGILDRLRAYEPDGAHGLPPEPPL